MEKRHMAFPSQQLKNIALDFVRSWEEGRGINLQEWLSLHNGLEQATKDAMLNFGMVYGIVRTKALRARYGSQTSVDASNLTPLITEECVTFLLMECLDQPVEWDRMETSIDIVVWETEHDNILNPERSDDEELLKMVKRAIEATDEDFPQNDSPPH